MPKSQELRHILKILAAQGFFLVSQNGSHAKYRTMKQPIRTVIVPIHGKEVPIGTLRSIVKQSGLLLEDFLK